MKNVNVNVLELFINARDRQVADHKGLVTGTEAEKLAMMVRLQKANDILDLTAKYGGDFKKAATEYVEAKAVAGTPQVHFHRHQPC